MKRSEIAMIILIASLSMLLTFTLAQSLLGDKVKRKASVEQANPITEELVEPAKRVFNEDAINPTVEVCVEGTQTSDVSSTSCQGSSTDTTAATQDESAPSGSTTTQSTNQAQQKQNSTN